MDRKIFTVLATVLFVVASCSNDKDSDTDPEMMMEEEEMMEARTAIPDVAFERALIEEGIDDEEDGSVSTDAITSVVDLVLEDKGITNLQGIEDFTMLEGLWLADNQLQSVDLRANSNLLFVFVRNNGLQSLNVSGLTLLEKIEANDNALESLDISDNTALQQLTLNNNLLQSIDISNLPGGTQLNTFNIEDNPLDCIQVNEDQLNDIPAQWTKDMEDSYALDCSL